MQCGLLAPVRAGADVAPAGDTVVPAGGVVPADDAVAGAAASHNAGTAVTTASPTLAFTSMNDLHDIFARFLGHQGSIRPRYKRARKNTA